MSSKTTLLQEKTSDVSLWEKQEELESTVSSKKAAVSFTVLIALCFMLAVTTFALLVTTVSVYNNLFTTGSVSVQFNGGKKVFSETDLLLSPGQTLERPMTITNIGEAPAYCRIYIENVRGSLNEALLFHIYDDGQLVKTVRPCDFTAQNALKLPAALQPGETYSYLVQVVMEENGGNTYTESGVTFDFIVHAVQAVNNPDREF